MIKNVNKCYLGNIEVRNYDVRKCIDRNENLEVYYEGKKMTLTPDKLRDEVVSRSGPFNSKFGGSNYYLFAYKWIPDESRNTEPDQY